MAKLTSVLKLIFAAIVALVAYVANDCWKMLYLTQTSAEQSNMALVDLSKCPAVDMATFKARAFKTPTIEVATIEECLRHGENMNQPLICRLNGASAANEQKIIDAIFADDSTYEMVCRDNGDFHYPTHHRKINATIAEVAAVPSPCSAGFIYGDKHQALLQSVMPTMHNKFNPATMKDEFKLTGKSSFLAGTSFASNFEEKRISTGSHAAMVTSMAYQLAGTKKWLLHNHEESTSEYFYQSGWGLYPTCLSSFLSGIKTPYTAVTGPGDILFFPFAWQHLVFTEPGPNVMTNIRKVAKPQLSFLFNRFSLSSMVKIILFDITKKDITGNPRQGADNLIFAWTQKMRDVAPVLEQENIKKLITYLGDLI